MRQKRYQYWGRVNGSPTIMWTKWFTCRGNSTEPIQMKGFKGNNLRNEYREV